LYRSAGPAEKRRQKLDAACNMALQGEVRKRPWFMRRRTLEIGVAVGLVALAIGAAFLLRKRAAPEPARLLPEAQAYVYLDLRPLRQLGVLGNKPVLVDDPEYQEFVRVTGIEFERDLDEAAFAIHEPAQPSDAAPASRAPAEFHRYSEIFRGHFDSQRVARYFRRVARSLEPYREVEIYVIPLEGRTVRVALLGVGIAAVSNTDGPRAIQYMIDRYKEVALPFGGPRLVRNYYRHVPYGSLFWGIAGVSNQGGRETPLPLPGGFDLFFPANTVLVGSVRYTLGIQLHAEAYTESPEEAKRVADQMQAFLGIFHGLENSMSVSGADPDVKAFFASLQVEQYKNRAILDASLRPGFVKKIFSEPPAQITGAPALSPPPTPKARPRHRR
jgi:hypothetical protein